VKVKEVESREKGVGIKGICRELGLSEVWVRRMLSKRIGKLGSGGYKDVDGLWRVSVEVLEEVKGEYGDKREKYRKRKSGELSKYYGEYVCDGVKCCRVLRKIVGGYSWEEEGEKEKIEWLMKVLDKIEKVEMVKWEERKKRREGRKGG